MDEETPVEPPVLSTDIEPVDPISPDLATIDNLVALAEQIIQIPPPLTDLVGTSPVLLEIATNLTDMLHAKGDIRCGEQILKIVSALTYGVQNELKSTHISDSSPSPPAEPPSKSDPDADPNHVAALEQEIASLNATIAQLQRESAHRESVDTGNSSLVERQQRVLVKLESQLETAIGQNSELSQSLKEMRSIIAQKPGGEFEVSHQGFPPDSVEGAQLRDAVNRLMVFLMKFAESGNADLSILDMESGYPSFTPKERQLKDSVLKCVRFLEAHGLADRSEIELPGDSDSPWTRYSQSAINSALLRVCQQYNDDHQCVRQLKQLLDTSIDTDQLPALVSERISTVTISTRPAERYKSSSEVADLKTKHELYLKLLSGELTGIVSLPYGASDESIRNAVRSLVFRTREAEREAAMVRKVLVSHGSDPYDDVGPRTFTESPRSKAGSGTGQARSLRLPSSSSLGK
jgi:hypothetical protein